MRVCRLLFLQSVSQSWHKIYIFQISASRERCVEKLCSGLLFHVELWLPEKDTFKIIQYWGNIGGGGERQSKTLPSSSLERLLLSNQHATLHEDSISSPLAVAGKPHNQGVGCWNDELPACWGLARGAQFFFSGDVAQKLPSHAAVRSLSQPVILPDSETKRSSILQEHSTLPGDGASYPCIASGVSEEVGSMKVGGALSRQQRSTSARTHQHSHISLWTSLLLKGNTTSISANEKCLFLFLFSLAL